MSFRVVTEGEEALRAYRKFLKGDPLIEAEDGGIDPPGTLASQDSENPEGTSRMDAEDRQQGQQAAALMQKLQEQLKAKNFEEVEKTADSILKMMGVKRGGRPGQGCAMRASSTLLPR